eukprot:11654191-Ditylum_brightwellii.AAC.4
MSKKEKQEVKPDVVGSADRKQGWRFQGQRVGRFQSKCNNLREVVFDISDPKASNKFEEFKNKISIYVSVNFTFSTELKRTIKKLDKVDVTRPDEIEDTASALDRAIFAEEVKEYVRNKRLLKGVKKQAYTLVWGQCSKATREKLHAADDFAII